MTSENSLSLSPLRLNAECKRSFFEHRVKPFISLCLNPEGKRSFMEHSLKLIRDGRSVKFLKLPFVSKGFLKIARVQPFYILTVHKCLMGDQFTLRFLDASVCKKYSAFDTFYSHFQRSYYFDMPYDKTQNLVYLLQPRYLCADINGFCLPKELMGVYNELFDLFSGKLLLFLTGFNKKFGKLLERLAPRLHVLYSMPMLLTERSTPLMSLDCYGPIGNVDFEQLQGILRHDIKTLCLSINYRFDIPRSVSGVKHEISAINNSLNYLNVDCSTPLETLSPLVDCMKQMCPQLNISSFYVKSYVRNMVSIARIDQSYHNL